MAGNHTKDFPQEEWDRNVLAAAMAMLSAAASRTQRRPQAGGKPDHTTMLVAAVFLRANPTAPAEALAMQLHLRRLRDRPVFTESEAAGWSVFAHVLRVYDALDRTDREAASHQAAMTSPRRGAPREALAMVPPDRDPRTDAARAFARRKPQ